MALTESFCHHGVHVALWRMDETLDQLCLLLGADGSNLRLAAEARFSSPARQREWLAVRACLQQVLGTRGVAYRPNGEPYLPDSNLRISISHTVGHVALAWGARPVGVDVEYLSPRAEKLKHRIASPNERRAEPADDAARVAYYTALWTIKETLFKALDIRWLDYQRGILLARPERLAQAMQVAPTASEPADVVTLDALYCTDGYRYPLQVSVSRGVDRMLSFMMA